MNNSPVIFLHKTNPPHLKIALDRLKLSNMDSEIILLGDESNKNISRVTHYFIDDYFINAKDFEDNYYIHMSKNPYQFELICYQRWFVICEFMQKQGYKDCWYFDSDVIVYGNLKDYLKSIPNYNQYDLIGFDSPKVGSFNPSFNFFTLKYIQDITEYITHSYVDNKIFAQMENKWMRHIQENEPGGVCDMTQLTTFLFDKSLSIYNIYSIDNDIISDGNINTNTNDDGTRFKMIEGIKYTEIIRYNAFVYLEDGTKKKLISTHFQGTAKKLMKLYSKKNVDTKKILLYYNYLEIIRIKDRFLALCKNILTRFLP